jgi:hypothetical protein
MEVRGLLQTIGMEAVVLAFLFGVTYVAVRISLAERRAQANPDEAISRVRGEHQSY